MKCSLMYCTVCSYSTVHHSGLCRNYEVQHSVLFRYVQYSVQECALQCVGIVQCRTVYCAGISCTVCAGIAK